MVTISRLRQTAVHFFCSLRFVVFLLFFALTSVCILIFGQVLEHTYSTKVLDQKISQAQLQCNKLMNQVIAQDFHFDDGTDTVNADMEQLANVLDGRIMVVDDSFRVVKDTYAFDEGKYLITENVLHTMKGAGTTSTRRSDRYMELYMPVEDGRDGTVRGVIVASTSIKDMEETAGQINDQANVLYAMFFIVIILLGVLLAYLAGKDFRRLNRQIRHISEGNMDETIHVTHAYSEIRDMAEGFNDIIGKLQTLENSRQEFVSNVSHELKTPITSMKILADSLVADPDAPVELYQEFMQDIRDEIDRENRIINDLLSLVKMDKKASELNIESVNINGLLETLLKRLRPLALERNIELVFESIRPVTAEIDEVKLSLAISNIVENAIKYNVDGGWVRVSLNADHQYFFVKVQDSGIGIPEESQEQIFERFYRVDKVRTQETSGTGLGLSITRNAIRMHNGNIKMYSREGEGTTFTIRIPLTYAA